MKSKPTTTMVRSAKRGDTAIPGGVVKKYQPKHSGLTITLSTKGTVSSKHAMATRGATACAARNAVFNTQELLENILVHVPTKHLSTVQGVCSHWRVTMKTSPRLQRGNFLRIVKEHTLLWFDKTKHTIKKQDPNDLTRFGHDWLARQTPIHTSTLNTTFFTTAPDTARQPLSARCVMCETITLLAQPNFDAAWKSRNTANKMFVANPPPVNVEMEVAYALISPRTGKKNLRVAVDRTMFPERCTLVNPDGVTWADLAKELDVLVYKANLRRATGTPRVMLDAEKCKFWMRGVVFPTEGEMGVLDGGGSLGQEEGGKGKDGGNGETEG